MALNSSAKSTGGIIYVAGYSRSGSTILGMLLGAHPDICCVGEVNNIISDWNNAACFCSCGARYADCEFWHGLKKSVPLSSELADRFHELERRARVGVLMNGSIPAADIKAYGDFVRPLFAYVRNAAKRRFILDSSKSARGATGRMVALKRYSGEPVYVIHLIRSLPATVESYLTHGSNWAREGLRHERRFRQLRAMAGWFLTHRMVIRLRKLFPSDHQITVYYEDLMEDPERVLKQIGRMLGLDMTPVLDKISAETPFVAAHDVGGNRTRLKPQILRRGKVPAGKIPLIYRMISDRLGKYIDRSLPENS
jgi:hypothetical protein